MRDSLCIWMRFNVNSTAHAIAALQSLLPLGRVPTECLARILSGVPALPCRRIAANDLSEIQSTTDSGSWEVGYESIPSPLGRNKTRKETQIA